MVKSTPEKTRRYQPRLSLDDRLGEVFEELMALPEELRKHELTFLVQLGFLTKKAMAHGAANAITSTLGTPSHVAAGNQVPREAVPAPAKPAATQSAEEMAGSAVASLDGWVVEDESFPT